MGGREFRMSKLLSFGDVLKQNKDRAKLHLVLGNGFSIARFPNLFAYDALFSRANFGGHPRLKRIFDRLRSHDFEAVMRHLVMVAESGQEYGLTADNVKEVKSDIEA